MKITKQLLENVSNDIRLKIINSGLLGIELGDEITVGDMSLFKAIDLLSKTSICNHSIKCLRFYNTKYGNSFVKLYSHNNITSTHSNGFNYVEKYDYELKTLTYNDSKGFSYTTTFDDSGNVLTHINSNNYFKNITYIDGKILKYTDSKNTIIYTYDSNNNIVTKLKNGSLNEYVYCENGYVLSKKSKKNNFTNINDLNGNILKRTHSNGKYFIQTFDDKGNRLTYINNKGILSEFNYDDIGNLIRTNIGGIVYNHELQKYDLTLFKY